MATRSGKRKRGDESHPLRGIMTRSKSEVYLHRTRSGCARADPRRRPAVNGEALPDRSISRQRAPDGPVLYAVATGAGSIKDLRAHRVFSPPSIDRDSDSDDGGKKRVCGGKKEVELDPGLARPRTSGSENVVAAHDAEERVGEGGSETRESLGFVGADMECRNGRCQDPVSDGSEDTACGPGEEGMERDLESVIAQSNSAVVSPGDGFFAISAADVNGIVWNVLRDLGSVDVSDRGDLSVDGTVGIPQVATEEVVNDTGAGSDQILSADQVPELPETGPRGACEEETMRESAFIELPMETADGFGEENIGLLKMTSGSVPIEVQKDLEVPDLKIVAEKHTRVEESNTQAIEEDLGYAGASKNIVKPLADDDSLLNYKNVDKVEYSNVEGAVRAIDAVGSAGQEDQAGRDGVPPSNAVIGATSNTIKRKPIKIFHRFNSPSYRKLLPFLMNLTKDDSYDIEVKPYKRSPKKVGNKVQGGLKMSSEGTLCCSSGSETAKPAANVCSRSDLNADLSPQPTVESHSSVRLENFEISRATKHTVDTSNTFEKSASTLWNSNSSLFHPILDEELDKPVASVHTEPDPPSNSSPIPFEIAAPSPFEIAAPSPTDSCIWQRENSCITGESEECCLTPPPSTLRFPLMSKLPEIPSLRQCSLHSDIERQKSSPLSVPSKGILKMHPQQDRGHCMDSFCSQSEKAFIFSQKQIQKAEDLVKDLTNELSHVRSVLQRSIISGHGEVAPPVVISCMQAEEICRRASEAEEMGKECLRQMTEDLKFHYRRPKVKFSDCVEEMPLSDFRHKVQDIRGDINIKIEH
ncbi:uncharacterized protein LOC116249794 [Nymphaea colorata]|nr:uncharacterized protein LOC116249794 [Nymphaea colorata]